MAPWSGRCLGAKDFGRSAANMGASGSTDGSEQVVGPTSGKSALLQHTLGPEPSFVIDVDEAHSIERRKTEGNLIVPLPSAASRGKSNINT